MGMSHLKQLVLARLCAVWRRSSAGWLLVAIYASQILGADGVCCDNYCEKLFNEDTCKNGQPNNLCSEDDHGICSCIWITTGDFVNYHCLANIEEPPSSGLAVRTMLFIVIPIVGVLCCCGMTTCWCLRHLGGYEEEVYNQETGEITRVRRQSVVRGMGEFRRRMSVVSVARTGSSGGAERSGSLNPNRRASSVAFRLASVGRALSFRRTPSGGRSPWGGDGEGGSSGLQRKRPAVLQTDVFGRTGSDQLPSAVDSPTPRSQHQSLTHVGSVPRSPHHSLTKIGSAVQRGSPSYVAPIVTPLRQASLTSPDAPSAAVVFTERPPMRPAPVFQLGPQPLSPTAAQAMRTPRRYLPHDIA
mmetsp:Transcript_37374/g.76689  ORF Transcript_37374/g.76689 Transcript_37374/m.76689 type:complete len:358 (-) Transcript_37374:122-1195(-)